MEALTQGLDRSVLLWSIGLAILVPVLLIALSELIQRLRSANSPYEIAFRALRNVFIPALTAVIVIHEVFGWRAGEVEGWEATICRVTDTIFWIAFAYTALIFLSSFTARAKIRTGDATTEPWEARVPAITRTVARVVVIIMPIAILASTVWNLDLNRFLTALGVGSIAVAFALQSTFSSVISGILLALDRPFKEGDLVEVDGHTGEVLEINWRTTQLLVEGRDVVIIPNTTLLDATLKNFTRHDVGYRDSISFGFAYRNMPNLVKEVALNVARQSPHVSNTPASEVHLVEYGDSSVNYEMHFHVDLYTSPFQARRIREDLMTRLFYAAARHDLEIPFPIRTVRETDTGDMTDDERAALGMKALQSSAATNSGQDDVLQELSLSTRIEDYGRGTPISEPGEHEDGIACILEGQVSIQTEAGQELNVLGPGDLIGARQVVGRRPNQMRTLALSDVVLARFPATALDQALGADASLARALHGYSDRLLERLERRKEKLS